MRVVRHELAVPLVGSVLRGKRGCPVLTGEGQRASEAVPMLTIRF